MRWLLLVVALGACGKKSDDAAKGGDDCQRFVDKAKPSFENLAKDSGKVFDDKVVAQLVEQCQSAKKQGKASDQVAMKCVLDAKDDAAVNACMEAAFGIYKNKAKINEATLKLNHIGKYLKVAYATNAEYPKGSVPLTPAKDCCATGGKCAPDGAAWSGNPIWTELDFAIDEPHSFRYSYESTDGQTAKATAVGDLDCDGTSITYTLEATTAGGNPALRVTAPDPSAD